MDEERMTSQDGSKRALSVEKPAVSAPPPPVPASGDGVFDVDPAALFDAVVLALPSSFGGGLEDEYPVILGDEEEELAGVYDDDDDDIELEGNDEPVIRFWNGEAAGSHNDMVARTVTFLGQPARFASYQDEGMAAFMRLAAVEAPPPAAGVIIVHYRYHRFTRPRSGGRGIEAPDYGTDLHHVRYLVPLPAVVADPASSLRLVDASLAGDVYPYRSHAQLQALWSGLLAAAPVRVPPRATGLVVTVDVGVLRSGDRTPERMECLRSALAEKAREATSSTCRRRCAATTSRARSPPLGQRSGGGWTTSSRGRCAPSATRCSSSRASRRGPGAPTSSTASAWSSSLPRCGIAALCAGVHCHSKACLID